MSKNFYENWLGLWDRSEKEKSEARKVIHQNELEWVRTRQDAKAALMIAPETGFRTWGGITMLAEIPQEWHTGSHSHGEESIYIIDGTGFSIIDDKQYEWEEGSCIRIPFGSVHQHFNDGDKPVRYLSAMAPHLEFLCGICKFEQYEDCGKNTGTVSRASPASSKTDSLDKLIVLRRRDMAVTYGGEALRNAPLTRFKESMGADVRKAMFSGDRNKGMSRMTIQMMGSRSDFLSEEVEITQVFHHPPGEVSGRHAHMEAILYVLEGEGYSEIDGEKVPWKTGSSLHVPGPQTMHQHFTGGNVECRHLRIHFGIRANFFQPIAKKKFPYQFFESRKSKTE